MLFVFGIFYSFYSSTRQEALELERVKEMTFEDDDTLLETYCDTIKFPSVKEYLEVEYSVLGKADDKVDGLTIHEASKNGNLLAVKIFVLVKKDIDIDAKDNFGWTALHYASSSGHKKVVEFLLSNGSAIEAKERDRMTALHLASYHGHEEVVKLLLSNGSTIEAIDRFGGTALHVASSNGHKKVVEYLLSKGSAIDAKDNDGSTALHFASKNGHKEVVKLLLSKSSDVNAKNKKGKTALQLSYDENIIAMLTTHAEIL